MSKILLFDTFEEWLKFREDNLTVTASVVGAVSGLNPYSSSYNVWERATKRIGRLPTTIPMKMGSYFEEGVMQIFKDDYEIEYLRDRSKILMYQHDTYDFIGVSPDDIAVYEGEEMLVEVKTTSIFFEEEDIPEYYISQIMFQLGVSGYKKCLLIWLNLFKKDYGFKVIEFDKDYYSLLLDAAIQFHDFVITDTPPPLTTQTDFNSLNVTEGVVNANDDITTVFYDACATQLELNRVKAHMDALKLKIAKYMDDNSELVRDDVKLVTYKTQETRRVDSKKLKEADLYDEYSSVTASRKMSIKYKNIDKL